MRRLAGLIVMAGGALTALAADPPAATGVKVGADLPGPFHPYNVTGDKAAHYHCLITRIGLDPGVMVVVRGLDSGEPLKNLLKGLDNAAEKNPRVRLGSFVVFVSPDLPKVVEMDDDRERAETKVKDFAAGAAVKHPVLALASPADLEKYGLADDAAVTVILFHKAKAVALHAMTREQFTDDKVKAILGEVRDKLGAKRE